jgi:hypothetical protein
MVDDYVLKFNNFDIMKEKNGVRLPHQVKQLESQPPCPANVITENVKIKEQLGNKD